jgi:hypothetical protein
VKHADVVWFDSSRAGYHLVLGFRFYVRCRLIVVWVSDKQAKVLLHYCIS